MATKARRENGQNKILLSPKAVMAKGRQEALPSLASNKEVAVCHRKYNVLCSITCSLCVCTQNAHVSHCPLVMFGLHNTQCQTAIHHTQCSLKDIRCKAVSVKGSRKARVCCSKACLQEPLEEMLLVARRQQPWVAAGKGMAKMVGERQAGEVVTDMCGANGLLTHHPCHLLPSFRPTTTTDMMRTHQPHIPSFLS